MVCAVRYVVANLCVHPVYGVADVAHPAVARCGKRALQWVK